MGWFYMVQPGVRFSKPTMATSSVVTNTIQQNLQPSWLTIAKHTPG